MQANLTSLIHLKKQTKETKIRGVDSHNQESHFLLKNW